MVAVARAEVVAQDEKAADQFRAYLEGLQYEVLVTREVSSDPAPGADVVLYHVTPEAALAERRARPRPRRAGAALPRFWLDVVQFLRERLPGVPLLVAVPDGQNVADKALDAGATDVIDDTVTAKVFGRRMEMLQAYSRASAPRREVPMQPVARDPGRPQTGVLRVPLPTLRNPGSGRIDARRVAEYLGVSLKQLSAAIALPYAGVHKTPDGPRVQLAIGPIARALELADAALGSAQAVRMWLNQPLYELENESPLAVLLAGEAGALVTLLENAGAGIPG